MAEEPSLDLKALWYLGKQPSVCCCVCMETISSGALIRTFRVLPPGQERQQVNTVLHAPNQQDLILYNRHLSCLLVANIKYVTVSHVWNKTISDTQNQGLQDLQNPDVTRQVYDIATKIARGISEALTEDVEVWHDYISVPQWSSDVKTPILQAVHRIYAGSSLTVIHLDDVTPNMIDKFLYAKEDADRLDGMVGICNAKWYSRVWTSMEFIRSGKVRVMDSDLQLHGEESAQVYQGQLSRLWAEQVKKNGGNVHALEDRVNMGKNLVPWNLGPLSVCRADSKGRNFGLAFALLARRGCRDRNDFLYALKGIITGDSVTKLNGSNWDEMYVSLARQCIKDGDYTPLLVTPEFGRNDGLDVRDMPANNVREGYNDVYAYSMGTMTSPPEYHDTLILEDSNKIRIKMQNAGIVWKSEQWGNYAPVAHFCAHSLATPSVEKFAEAFASRLFGESTENIHQALMKDDHRQKLEQTIHALSKVSLGEPWPHQSPYNVWDINEALGLTTVWPGRSESRYDYQAFQGNVLHLTWRRAFVYIQCETCSVRSVVDAGIFIKNDKNQLDGATMYRFPRLGYQTSLENGICLFVNKEYKIVGRAVWATPACACESLEDVTLQMPNLPKPRPRSEFCRRLGWTIE